MDSLLYFTNLLCMVSDESKGRLEKSQKKFPFSPNEDKLLLLLVNKYGRKNWVKISSYFSDRSARQCRERFNIYLSPEIRHDDWTTEEDELLQELVETHGKKWAEIALSFQGRSANSIKNRYYVHIMKTRRKSHRKLTKVAKNTKAKGSKKTEEKGDNPDKTQIDEEGDIQTCVDDLFGIDISFDEILNNEDTFSNLDYFDI